MNFELLVIGLVLSIVPLALGLAVGPAEQLYLVPIGVALAITGIVLEIRFRQRLEGKERE